MLANVPTADKETEGSVGKFYAFLPLWACPLSVVLTHPTDTQV